MKINLRSFKIILFAILTFLVSCKSTKHVQVQAQKAVQTLPQISKCDQPIIYYSEKMSDLKAGQGVIANTEILINPLTKIISLNSVIPDQGKVSFNTVIESFDCNYSSDMMNGQALYKGYIKQLNGETTSVTIKVEINDGNIKILNVSPEKNNEWSIIVSRWEFVNE